MSVKYVRQAYFLVLAVALYGCYDKSGNSKDIAALSGEVVEKKEPVANILKAPATDMIVDEFGQVVKFAPKRTELTPDYIAALNPPDEMSGVLLAYDPSFKAWTIDVFPKGVVEFYPYSSKSLPYAAKGDFNGDGKVDIILSGHNTTQNLILGIISGATGYSVVPLWRGSFYNKLFPGKPAPSYTPTQTLCVQNIGKRFLSGDMDVETITLKNEGLTVKQFAKFNSTTNSFNNILGGIDLYEWDQDLKRFEGFYISDTGSVPFNTRF